MVTLLQLLSLFEIIVKLTFFRNYNQHWLIQEAEQRRIAEMQQRGNQYQSNSKSSSSAAASNKSNNTPSPSGPIYENSSSNKAPAPSSSSPSSSHFQVHH